MDAQQQKHAADTAVAYAERNLHEAHQHNLATSMRMAEDADTLTRLASSNKEKEAEITSLHQDHRLSAQNLEMHQARDIE
eukprot:5094999-Heterocapsa_arctica.AAC.1